MVARSVPRLLHYVTSKLSLQVDEETHVIFLTLCDDSGYLVGLEDAYQAILGRIAYEYTGSSLIDSYDGFSEKYTDFGDVNLWVRANKVILVVDLLNAIPLMLAATRKCVISWTSLWGEKAVP